MAGALRVCGAMLSFTFMSAFVKETADAVPAGQAVFFRSLFALPVIFGWIWLNGQLRDGLRTRRWKSHALRGLAGSTAMGLGIAGLAYLPLPEVTAIRFVTPILVLILAALLLGERFRLFRLGAVLFGLVGVVIIIWPRLGGGRADRASRRRCHHLHWRDTDR